MMHYKNRQFLPSGKDFLELAVVFTVFLVVARLSAYFLSYDNTSPALIWPPAGIAFVAMILRGYKIWPALFLGALINSILNNNSAIVVASATLGITFMPVVGTYLLRRAKFSLSLNRLRDVINLIAMSALSGVIVPTFIFVIPRLFGQPSFVNVNNWIWIWTGHSVVIFLTTSLLSVWAGESKEDISRRKLLQAVITVFSLIAVFYAYLFTPVKQVGSFSLMYIILLQLTLIALYFRVKTMVLSLFILSVMGIFGAITFTGDIPISQRLISLEVFIIVVGGVFLMLSSLSEEQRVTSSRLRDQISQVSDALNRVKKENEAKNEFLSVLAHELRNPLAPIKSTIELMESDGRMTREELMGSVSVINRQTKLMARLIDDLLDISRISRGKIMLRKEVADVKTIIKNAIETSGPAISKGRHTLELNISPDPLFLETDPVRLEQIIVNLLNNAARHTDHPGKIILSCFREGDKLVISVKDYGRGIQKEFLDYIFEGSDTLIKSLDRRESGGLGIGLRLVKNLVELHSGMITAYSEGLGKGSEFKVILPARRKSDMPQEAGSQPEPEKIRRKETVTVVLASEKNDRILVVDDNEDAANSLGKLIGRMGHEVKIAYEGKTALEIFKEWKPGAILLDIAMPQMDGCQVAEEIRKTNKKVVLIALTGYGTEEDRHRCINAGFNIHLTKPVGIDELKNILKRLKID